MRCAKATENVYGVEVAEVKIIPGFYKPESQYMYLKIVYSL